MDPTAWIVAASAIIGTLLVLAAGLGAWAAFRTARNSSILDQYKTLAEEAKGTAEIWKGRSEATQAELDAQVRKQAEDKSKSDIALNAAQHQIADLQIQVATLKGVVSASDEIKVLTVAIADLTTQIREDHRSIMDRLGAR